MRAIRRPENARCGPTRDATDQEWIESLFGHPKGEFPHLEKIDDIDVLRAELQIRRTVTTRPPGSLPLHFRWVEVAGGLRRVGVDRAG
ncbi:hypothetical protein BN381_130234 [Candidatus Microthrix parvicella RN1]|mgnify:FL=1|uniref:Uncharacterized protein n=1 Tax=Candidatus Neomicrothrix parvicella RN1 TaxID=1229780 RepID=R4Z076_9ACTN|nr:hypothetical protein BN381_130234 [Candidatus Microthrix parvicella RN1]